MFEILAHPVLAPSLAALAVVFCACFSMILKRDVRRIHMSHQEHQRAAATQIRDLTLQVASLEETVKELEKKAKKDVREGLEEQTINDADNAAKD